MRGRFMNEQEVENIIKKQMEENHGIVKKEVLTKQGIDYRRINQLVKDGKLKKDFIKSNISCMMLVIT